MYRIILEVGFSQDQFTLRLIHYLRKCSTSCSVGRARWYVSGHGDWLDLNELFVGLVGPPIQRAEYVPKQTQFSGSREETPCTRMRQLTNIIIISSFLSIYQLFPN